MDDHKTTRILLLGKTGAGKSSLANTIFGGKVFNVFPGFNSGTSVCEAKTKSVNGRKITLIDVPGFIDTNIPGEKLKPEMVKCIIQSSPGLHAFLIVLKLERFTEHEEAFINKITEYLSEDMFKYTTVVFTHGKELPKGKTIKDLVKETKSLSHFIDKCGGRCHVIDNKHWNSPLKCKYRNNRYQVKKILKSIDKTVETNNGKCYTNKELQKTEKLIQQEEKNIKESSENKTEEEIRREAEHRAYQFFIQATGVTVGALLGALCGVTMPALLGVACIADVVKSAILRAGAGVEEAAEEAGAAGAVGAGAGAVDTAGAVKAAGAVEEAAEEAGAAGAVGAVGAGAAGAAGAVKAGAGTAVGILAVVGAGFGGFVGHEAAKGAETAQKAAQMAAEAVWSKGLQIIGAQNLVSQLDTKSEKKMIEKDSNT